MSAQGSHKVTFVLWPRRLAVKEAEGFSFVGWVWWQRARLVKNSYHGWIAFQDQQKEEHLRVCGSCGKPLKEVS